MKSTAVIDRFFSRLVCSSRRGRAASVVILSLVLTLSLSSVASAQTLVGSAPVGGEFRVNTYTTGDQHYPSVATDADGDFVVGWSSSSQDGSGWGVYAQRYRNNFAPVATDDAAVTNEDNPQTFNVLTNDNDPDGDALSVASSTQGSHGSVSCNQGGQCTYTPQANYSGTDSFTYTASDGYSGTHTASVIITVSAENDAPTISDVADKTIERATNTGSISFSVSDVESAADSLTVTGSSSNTTLVPDANIVFGGTGTERTVTVTPAASEVSTAIITVRVSDGSAEVSDTFVLTVQDTTAPTLIGKSPEPRSTEVSPTANVVATFSEAMMRSSLTKSTVTLVKKGTTRKVGASLRYPAPNKVKLNPSTSLERGATYTVTIVGGSNGVKDLAGNALAANVSWSFKVRA